MNTHHFKIIILFLFFISGTSSFSMDIMPAKGYSSHVDMYAASALYKKIHSTQFCLPAPATRLLLCAPSMKIVLPEEMQLKIFALTKPAVKNYWIMTSKHWKEIGAKNKQNTYKLIEHYSPVCAAPEDITFMLFNAAFDGKVEMTRRILEDNSHQKNFFYEFFERYDWSDDAHLTLGYFDVQDIIRDQEIALNIAIDHHGAENLIEKRNANNAIKELLGNHIDEQKRYQKKYALSKTRPCGGTYDVMLNSYAGLALPITDVLRHPNAISSCAVERINYALCIAIHKNNKAMVPIILDFIKKNKEDSKAYYRSIRFFNLAIFHKRKEIFEMLIEFCGDMLNESYHKFELILYDKSFENFECPIGTKFTYLDWMNYHANTHPHLHLDDYITIIEKYGGKPACEILQS